MRTATPRCKAFKRAAKTGNDSARISEGVQKGDSLQLLQESKPGVEISIVETAESMYLTVESAEWSGEKNGATVMPPMPLAPAENRAL